MEILTCKGWEDYQLLDSGNGFRLEQFGKYTIIRPDPQVIWQPFLPETEWKKADVSFTRLKADSGTWQLKSTLPAKWLMKYKNISFWARLTSFKHTGVFPEQSLQWEWITEQISSRLRSNNKNAVILGRSKTTTPESIKGIDAGHLPEIATSSREGGTPRKDDRNPSVLNLFGYTGIASLAAAAAGAKVTHIDASRPSITWARENQEASQLSDKPIRWILEDAVKFVEREIKRGNTYDGIIMDPPVYGHGPTGQIWKFNDNFPRLMELCRKILSPSPLFVVVNAYAISSSALMLENVLNDFLKDLKGNISVGELVLEEKFGKRPLSTGIYGRWESQR